MSSIHLYNNHHLGIQYVFKSVSLKGSARICVKSLISSNIIIHLGSSWSLSISSWSTTVTVSSTSWRFMRGAWPLGHWWAATVGGTRPSAMCPPPTVSTSTSGQTTRSAGQASGSDTRQVSGKTKYSLDLPNGLSFQRVVGNTAAPVASSGPPTTPPTTPSTGAACTGCQPPGVRSSRYSSGASEKVNYFFIRYALIIKSSSLWSAMLSNVFTIFLLDWSVESHFGVYLTPARALIKILKKSRTNGQCIWDPFCIMMLGSIVKTWWW